MSNWTLLNKARAKEGPYASQESDGFNGFFPMLINGLKIKVIASDGEGWRHVSVSIHKSNMTPSWEIMCKVKDLFFEDEDVVVQYHPAKSEYVNFHPGCLHLWQPIGQTIPTPPPVMVGYNRQPKNETQRPDDPAP